MQDSLQDTMNLSFDELRVSSFAESEIKLSMSAAMSERKNPLRWSLSRYRDLFQLHQLLRSPAFHELPPLPTRRAFGLGKWLFQQDEEW